MMTPDRAGVGVFALDTLTTGMYHDPFAVVRELVQNSCDAIREAEDTGILTPGTGEVVIHLDRAARTLRVRDNGAGIPQESARRVLLDVGKSRKDARRTIGFRGIGRLAGIAYADHLSFEGTEAGSGAACRVTFDCKRLRQLMDPTCRSDDELGEVLYAAHDYAEIDASPDSHYFEAALIGLSREDDAVLDSDSLYPYLSATVPVSYDSQRFMWWGEIEDYACRRGSPLFRVIMRISVDGGERLVFKPYRGRYKTGGTPAQPVELEGVEFIEDSEYGRYWGWYSRTALLGAIDDASAAGLRIRKNNMALGGRELTDQFFRESRFNAWYVGEIHITDDGCIPNARRDGFEPVGSWPLVRDALKRLGETLGGECHRVSKRRNEPAAKVAQRLSEAIDHARRKMEDGFASATEREQTAARIREAADAVRRTPERQLAKAGVDATKVHAMVIAADQAIENVRSCRDFAALRTRSTLDRSKRKMLAEVLEILRTTLPEDMYDAAKAALLRHFGQ